MAVATNSFSPKEFSFLIAEQDDWGTINEDTGGTPDNPYIALDVDSIESPDLGLIQVLEQRSGSRILQATDFFQDKLAAVKEITVSGTATTAGLDMMLSNITGEDITSATGVYSILSNQASETFDASTTANTTEKLLSIVYKSGYGTTADIGFKDCFCTQLILSGAADTEGGRVKFSATFKSGSAVDPELTTTTIDTAITSNDYFMSAWDADDRIVAGIANALVNSFSLTITNDVIFAGVTSAGFESAAKVGELMAVADFNVKYDSNFKGVFNIFDDQTAGTSQGATLMNHQAALADANFGFKMASSVLTSVAFAEGEMMALDLSVKALGAGITSSTAMVEVAC